MPNLFNFSNNIPVQTNEVLTFGVKSIEKFRLTSSFVFSNSEKVFSVFKGTILLQQQASDINKVNLILKPYDLQGINFFVKYVIYRGLDLNSFLNGNDLTQSNTKVKTNGTELLVRMQEIQQERNSGVTPIPEIPLQALFGYELSPENDFQIDKFFFSQQSPNSQLFTVEGGVELGKFAPGEAGIEIILENPVFFPTVEMAKKVFFEIDVTLTTDLNKKKWEKEQIIYFIDPAAFYGMHYNIKGGIGYKDAGGNQIANTIELVYNKILSPFYTKNRVYLDIRNENGYSYNYYNNYTGTGANESKEIKIGQDLTNLQLSEYYNNEWPIHIVEGIIPSNNSNENLFHICLRINDNKKPLIAGWNINISPYSSIDKNVVFIDETKIIDNPIPNLLPEFSKPLSIAVPNILSLNKQLGAFVRLDYLKQINVDALYIPTVFPDRTDFLFGPISSKIPFETLQGGVTWINHNNSVYSDSLSQGFAISSRTEKTIYNVDLTGNSITVNEDLNVEISNEIQLQYYENSTEIVIILATFTIKRVERVSNQTVIFLNEPIPNTVSSGDNLFYKAEIQVYIDKNNNFLLVKNLDLTNSEVFQIGKTVRLYSIFKSNSKKRFTITNITFQNNNSYIYFNPEVKKIGFGAIMSTGIVTEINIDNSSLDNNERICFYAIPQYYYSKSGTRNSNLFNYRGGKDEKNSFFFDVIGRNNHNFSIEKSELKISETETISILSYDRSVKVKENFYFLGITKQEFLLLESNANSELSSNHLITFKLISTENQLRDINYQSYYKYDLVGFGIDNNGVFKKTIFKIDVYSKDGLIFTSNEYASSYIKTIPQVSNTCDKCSNDILTVSSLSSFMQKAKDSNGVGLGSIPTSGAYSNRVPAYINYLNDYMTIFGINNNCLRRAHFLGQVAKETKFWSYKEDFNYTKAGMDAAKFPNRDVAKQYARENASDPPVSEINQIKIGNVGYGTGSKASELGNSLCPSNLIHDPEQDGYKYRGRGLIQLTGKANYSGFQTWYNTNRVKLELPSVDFISNPDLVFEPQYIVLSAIYFWDKNSMNNDADKGSENTDIDRITNKINSGEDRAKKDIRIKFVKSALSNLRDNNVCKIVNQSAIAPNSISGNSIWRNPIDNPCITIYTFGGSKRPWRSAFGVMRGDLKRKSPPTAPRPHHGIDLFANIGTKVYACIQGTVVYSDTLSGYGKTVIIKVLNVEDFHKQRRNYELFYEDTPEKRNNYINNTEFQMSGYPPYEEKEGVTTSSEVYLKFAHLSKIYVTKDEIVNSDKCIGLSGDTGAEGTKGPHLHFEIRTTSLTNATISNEWDILYNPAFYIDYKNEFQLTEQERKEQDDAAIN
jgi:predicted chitinase